MPDPVPPPDFLRELFELLRRLGFNPTPSGVDEAGRLVWKWTSPGPRPAPWYWRWWLWLRLRVPWLARLLLWLVRALPLILLILLILVLLFAMAKCAQDFNTKVAAPIPSGPVCQSDGRDKIYRTVFTTAWGCRTSMNDAFAQAAQFCTTLQGSCGGGCQAGKPCQTGVVVKDVSQAPSWFDCGTFVGFSCDCGCGSAGSP